MAWKMALCSLSTGRIRPPGPGRQIHDERPGDDERFLVGQGDRLAGFQRRPGAAQPGRPDDGRDDHIDVRGLNAAGHSSGSVSSSMPSAIPCHRRSSPGQGHPLGRNRRACSNKSSRRDRAARPTTSNRPGRAATTSSAFVPIDPVDPRTTSRRGEASESERAPGLTSGLVRAEKPSRHSRGRDAKVARYRRKRKPGDGVARFPSGQARRLALEEQRFRQYVNTHNDDPSDHDHDERAAAAPTLVIRR